MSSRPDDFDVPPPPEMLMDALHGAVHIECGEEHRGRLKLRSSRPEPPPQNGTGDALWPAVIARYADRPAFASAARERHEFGVAKYSVALRANNGRNARIDALQEALDLVVYLEQMTQEEPNGWAAMEIRQRQANAVDLAQWLLEWVD